LRVSTLGPVKVEIGTVVFGDLLETFGVQHGEHVAG
jgi:hypothetical protein